MNKPFQIINTQELQILLNNFDKIDCNFPIFSNFQLFEGTPIDMGYKIDIINRRFVWNW
ncbi:MAG: hypothetical protein GF329_03040 [Candidatus Lokiarchaeota archaeon]|nr:hypothetical protein [Candidatus Lokiarchaeota archaeon]